MSKVDNHCALDVSHLNEGIRSLEVRRPKFEEGCPEASIREDQEVLTLRAEEVGSQKACINVRNDPPRGELRDSPNNESSYLCRKLRIKFCHLVFCFDWVPSKTSKGFDGFPLGEWTSIQVGVQDLSTNGGLLDRGPSFCDPKRGHREVAGEFL